MALIKKIDLLGWTLIALVLGVLVGLALLDSPEFATNYLQPFGTIFVNLLKLVVVPACLLSVIIGTSSLGGIGKVGSLGWKTSVYFLITTLISVTIGLSIGMATKGFFPVLNTEDVVYEAKIASFTDMLVGIFPTNMWAAFSNSSMIQVIVIALLIGAGILAVGKEAEPFSHALQSAYSIVSVIMSFVIACSPVGVFCLMACTVAVNGLQVFGSLMVVVGAIYLGLLIHIVVVYTICVGAIGRKSPVRYFKEMIPAIAFACASCSSLATLPVSIECTKKAGANPEYCSFILPFGAGVNKDAAGVYQGISTIFVAACYGVDLELPALLMIAFAVTVSSIGTAGMPGGAVATLAMVLTSVGLPIEGMALLIGIDKLTDVGRTVVNVLGNSVGAIVMTQIEGRKQDE